MAGYTAFQVKKLYDGTMAEPMEDAIVVFDQTGIAEVLAPQDAGLGAQRYGIDVVDKRTFYMTPGLIDAHVHVHSPANGPLSGSIFDQMTTGEVQIMAYQNAMTALRAGVTTLRDCGTERDIAIHTRNYIDRTGIGPDLLVCGGGLCTTAGHGYAPENAVDGPDEVRTRIRELQDKRVDFIKLMATTEIYPRPASRVIGFSRDELVAAIEEAHRLNYVVCAHATFTELIELLTDLGVDGVEHCMFANSNWSSLDLDARLCEKMLKKGVMPDHTLAVSVCTLHHLQKKQRAGTITPEEEAMLPAQYANKERLMKQFSFQIAQGLPSIAGSDAGFEYSGFDDGMALTMALMGEGGMSNRAVIHGATGLPAQHFRIDDRLGTIAPGKQADFLLLREDPGQDLSTFFRVAAVYKRGCWVE